MQINKQTTDYEVRAGLLQSALEKMIEADPTMQAALNAVTGNNPAGVTRFVSALQAAGALPKTSDWFKFAVLAAADSDYSYTEIAKMFNVSVSHVGSVLRKVRDTHAGVSATAKQAEAPAAVTGAAPEQTDPEETAPEEPVAQDAEPSLEEFLRMTPEQWKQLPPELFAKLRGLVQERIASLSAAPAPAPASAPAPAPAQQAAVYDTPTPAHTGWNDLSGEEIHKQLRKKSITVEGAPDEGLPAGIMVDSLPVTDRRMAE